MLHFECDYACGAAQPVLDALVRTNGEETSGYGEDPHCERARDLIRQQCRCPEAAVHFVTGGTQANLTVIAAGLRPFEGVLCADTGHINVHETGSVEATGHKVLALPGREGKISAGQVRAAVEAHRADATHEHMVRPAMVYISHPTELGTLYTRTELEALSRTCRELGIRLFLDGARLGYALAAQPDVDLPFLAGTCDAFTIGGTKVGALCGEAVVFTKNNTPKHFMSAVKRHGALLAKGRLLGIQFDVLFTGGLYQEISRNAIGTAERLKQVFHEKGYRFYLESPTNQQFVILENSQMEKLAEQVRFSFWETYDESHTVVRFATSWATRMEDVEKLAELL